MSQLDAALDAIRSHEGVDHALVLGRDGLLIQYAGAGGLDAETVSAMVPGIAAAAGALGVASGAGQAGTVVAKMESGVAVVSVLSPEIILAVLVRPGVGFAPLLRHLSENGPRLASLV
ncbi:MAG TPA: roadblock/LC7 domain-containing protein [Longimicrobiaceae bacterium]|jgi:predicted regulator of Ras-like GTPase activity (Roadblock/LC7/MglB family)|nr:roadblock/LC7 domain-containing protein [Longimicrobiaceae bacterium]